MNWKSTLTSTLSIVALNAAILFQAGCAGPAASKPVKGAAVGGLVGAGAAAITGENAAVGALAGGTVGAIIGAVQQNRENKRQDTLAQQRAYNQAIAMQKRAREKEKAALQEGLEIAEGFRITQEELDEMTSRAETAEEELKALQAKRDNAIKRKRDLDELEEREKEAIAEASKLEQELAELEGGEISYGEPTTEKTTDQAL